MGAKDSKISFLPYEEAVKRGENVIWGLISLFNWCFFRFENIFTNTVAVSCIGKVCKIEDLIINKEVGGFELRV